MNKEQKELLKKINELEGLIKRLSANHTFPGEEIWRQSSDFPSYEVSTFGRVRVKSTRARVPGHQHSSRANTYHRYNIKDANNRARKVMAHVLVISTFKGASSNQVDHIDGNTLNNHLSNLEYVSQSENIKRRNKLAKAFKGE